MGPLARIAACEAAKTIGFSSAFDCSPKAKLVEWASRSTGFHSLFFSWSIPRQPPRRISEGRFGEQLLTQAGAVLKVRILYCWDVKVKEGFTINPFIEFFNLFNRNNPGANYVPNAAAFPTPVNNTANVTAFCLNSVCTQTQPITSLNQLRVPAGALGDFFGPGTTVGFPFAAQCGVRITF